MTISLECRVLVLALSLACALSAAADEPRAGPSGQVVARERPDRRAADAVPVNPFTGNDLAVERKQVELERAKLDEQIAAAELNRRKYQLEMQRLGSMPDFTGTASPMTSGAAALPAVPPGGAMIDAADAGPRADRATALRPPLQSAPAGHPAGRKKAPQSAAPDASKKQPDIVLVAVVESGGSRRAVFAADGRYVRAAPGDVVLGRRLESIDAKSAILAGQTLTLRDDVPTVAGVERKTERAHLSDYSPAGRSDASTTVLFPEAAARPQGAAGGIAGVIPPLTR